MIFDPFTPPLVALTWDYNNIVYPTSLIQCVRTLHHSIGIIWAVLNKQVTTVLEKNIKQLPLSYITIKISVALSSYQGKYIISLYLLTNLNYNMLSHIINKYIPRSSWQKKPKKNQTKPNQKSLASFCKLYLKRMMCPRTRSPWH